MPDRGLLNGSVAGADRLFLHFSLSRLTKGVKIFIALLEIVALQVDPGDRKKVADKGVLKFWGMLISLEATVLVACVRLILLLSFFLLW